MKKRNHYYDNLKGFAIILVVVGHAIQNAFPYFDSILLFRLIYSFHMPLFMLISGIISYNSCEKYDLYWLKKRAYSLILPFVSWVIVPIFIRKEWSLLPDLAVKIVKSPDNANWFLWVLFLNCFLLYCIYYLKRNCFDNVKNGIEVISILVCIAVWMLNKKFSYLGIGLLSWYCIFYLAGHFIAKYKAYLAMYKYYIGVILTITWIFLAPYWRRAENPSYIGMIGGLVGKVLTHTIIEYNYLVGFAGTGMVMFVVYVLGKRFQLKVLNELGQRTIEIYILQWFCFMFKFENKILEIVLNTIFGILLPWLVAIIFEKKIETKLLFGKGNFIDSNAS